MRGTGVVFGVVDQLVQQGGSAQDITISSLGNRQLICQARHPVDMEPIMTTALIRASCLGRSLEV